MNLQNYNENSIKTLAPREAVRENYAMYIGDNTSRGFHHLLTEIVANAMDEAASGFGNIIKVEIDTKQNKASVIDRGRGIPFRMNSEGKYAIKEMCTSLTVVESSPQQGTIKFFGVAWFEQQLLTL